MFAERLAQEKEFEVMKALVKLGESEREEGEGAFPSLGTILKVMRNQRGLVETEFKL